MRLSDVKTRLQAQLTGGAAFASIKGVANLAVAMQQGQFVGSAFIFVGSIDAGPNGLINAMSQRVRCKLCVLYGIRNVADATGEAAIDSTETQRLAVVGALIGWAPQADHEPFEYRKGSLAGFNNGTALWLDEFETAYLERKP
jgi:hypothetical protein